MADSVTVRFEGLIAVDDAGIIVQPDEIVGLIGPNGAGKTTLLNALSGFVSVTTGTVRVGGKNITGWQPNRLAKVGIARSFQSVRLFPTLTVLENLQLGALGVGLGLRQARARAKELLVVFELEHLAGVPAGSIPSGQSRLVGVARALATGPNFLLLDEPAAGLDDVETVALTATLQMVRRRFGVALLVVEHDMGLVMNLCDRVYVLDQGRNLFDGKPELVVANTDVRHAYLGTGYEHVTA